MRRFIVYHDRCVDGFTAAWVFWNFQPTGVLWHYVPLNHGEYDKTIGSLVLAKDDEIIFVDIGPTPEQLVALAEKVAFVTVLDHHKTMFEAWGRDGAEQYGHTEEKWRVYLNQNKSGARLAWDYCSGGNPPRLVTYVEDHDLWRKMLPDTEEVRSYIGSIAYDFAKYAELNRKLETPEGVGHVIDAGRALVAARNKVIDELQKKAEPLTIAGKLALVVNYGVSHTVSEIGHRLAYASQDGIGVVWSVNNDVVEVSLRSRKEVDVSEIAKSFGGGGHKNAAGFRVPLYEFMLRYKTLGAFV